MRTRRLLLIEDDPDDVELTALMLRGLGSAWEVEVVGGIGAAVARLPAGGLDLILMDLGLPDGRGAEAVRRVVSQAGGLPVVVQTGADHDERVARDALQAGARACLVKGKFDRDRLDEVLGPALPA